MKSILVKIKDLIVWLVSSIRTSIRDSYREAPPEMQKGARRILGGALAVVVLFMAWSFGRTYLERKNMEEELRRGPEVRVAKAVPGPTVRTVKLLGEARPYASVTLYAKVSGYLKSVLVDKGDIVKKGQVLAIIDSPETDKLFQASASDAKNKKSIAQRIEKLFERNLVSAQEVEQARADNEVANAHYESAEILKGYEVIRAPFAGTVTARFADPGALMQNATNSQTSALPVLTVAQVNELRVYAYLDQRDALFAGKGMPVEISLTEMPDLKVKGHISRLSGQLDEKTRMLLTEIDLDNKTNQIVAGSLVQVSLEINSTPGLEVPSEALVLREGKTTVAIVDANNEVTYTEVRVIENDGKKIKVQSGLTEGQTVALNLGNTVEDHGKVRPTEPEVKK